METERIIALAFVFLIPTHTLLAEEPSPENNFLTYDFSLSPDVSGNLNGRINLGLNWMPWLLTEIEAYTDDYSQNSNTDTDVSTLVSTDRAARLTALRINQDLLWLLIGTRLDFLQFSAGVIGVYDWTTQSQYGYDPSQPVPLFYLDTTDKTSLRFLHSYTLGVKLGPFSVTGGFESTIIWSNEGVISSHFTSGMAAAPQPTTTAFQGGDTLASGNASLDLGFLQVLAGFRYFLHIMTDGTAANTFKSETYTYSGSIALSFLKLAGGSPVVGASWVQKRDFIVASRETVENGSFRIDIGFRR
jgi:hypothetical protein